MLGTVMAAYRVTSAKTGLRKGKTGGGTVTKEVTLTVPFRGLKGLLVPRAGNSPAERLSVPEPFWISEIATWTPATVPTTWKSGCWLLAMVPPNVTQKNSVLMSLLGGGRNCTVTDPPMPPMLGRAFSDAWIWAAVTVLESKPPSGLVLNPLK